MNLSEEQRVVDLFNILLEANGVKLSKDSYILDFGCGSGRHVYEYLDFGFSNIYGFDKHNYVELRRQSDSFRFHFSTSGDLTNLPFQDNSFDFVYSTSVFEHVIEQEKSFREIFRVLKPRGVTIHVFPSKWRPIEPHILVPFAGAIHSASYLRFWANMGIRNSFQEKLKAKEVAEANLEYSRSGLKYLSDSELEAILSRIFASYKYEEILFIKYGAGRSKRLYPLMTVFPPLIALFRFAHTRVIYCKKKQ